MRFPIVVALMACAAPRLSEAAPAIAHPGPYPRVHPYTVELVDEHGAVLPTFHHRGRSYVLGNLGGRYLIRVRNASPHPVEIVASVDGRDVVDGRRASWEKRGYLVGPWGEVTIDGYRLSDQAVAAFRFSSVPDAYAARTGDARDVGVIGVAVFPGRYAGERHESRRDWYYDGRRWELPPGEGVPGPADDAREGAAPDSPSSGPGASRGQVAPGAPGAAPAPDASRADGSRSARPFHPDPGAQGRPGLGTGFGEQRESHVQTVAFERDRSRPDAIIALRYDDRRGLLALGIDLDGWREDDLALRESARPFRGSPAFAEPPPGWSLR